MVGFLNFVIGFVVSLLIGAFGIYVGARVIADRNDYEYAVLTALVGAFVWWLITGLFGIIPFAGEFIGAVLGLVAWVYVINARYPGGWGSAIGIGVVAWLAVWVVLVVLESLEIIASGALGVPWL
ncbi:hypothetical protein M0R89_12920 [Halorussus limi]|uniref:Uncharacterized protein n=1 Tax=Halorussus limi TaxID=2938695 RepID=A0A8U0HQU1_9EURY|nr:hypothetical protein [Halorussus limi]UPV73442.1 hypothetical protein M0R89_12920 [Halorussus limi]